jgi:hypothetical protein
LSHSVPADEFVDEYNRDQGESDFHFFGHAFEPSRHSIICFPDEPLILISRDVYHRL